MASGELLRLLLFTACHHPVPPSHPRGLQVCSVASLFLHCCLWIMEGAPDSSDVCIICPCMHPDYALPWCRCWSSTLLRCKLHDAGHVSQGHAWDSFQVHQSTRPILGFPGMPSMNSAVPTGPGVCLLWEMQASISSY